MSGGLGVKQIAILNLLLENKSKTISATTVKKIYGYESSALSALRGLEARGYLVFLGNGRWGRGPDYDEVVKDGRTLGNSEEDSEFAGENSQGARRRRG